MTKKITYTEAYDELEKIVSDLEAEEIQVDALSQKVKRAMELIRICKSKLRETEDDVKKVLEEMEGE